ncbi:MAG: sulfurtransferase [Rhodospirillaceae bacterium]|nr:sulfurtransferase [Rhodospirillaceae bacterium]|tara:strand:- start:3934 stop:4371 length:438 start_codon:yes stop_codon:yes gene_type:complete
MIRNFFVFLAFLLGTSATVFAADGVITASAASLEAQAGTRILIDVRHVTEWRQTGVPANAKEITIHDPNGLTSFVSKISAAVKGDKNAPIALICARGYRSTKAAQILAQAGFKNIRDVREGMLGNRDDGPGWLKRRLPTQPCKSC